MPARLSISTEEGLLLDTYLGSHPMRIGRAKDNSLRGEDRRISRRHAIVRRLPDGQYEIEDLGSSYGTYLNGRSISKEPLKHRDILRCGGLTIQFLLDAASDDLDEQADNSIVTATLDNLFEARGQIRRLIEEQALLRSEVGIAQEAEDRAKRLRDEAQDEVEALHKRIEELRREIASQRERIEELGQELRKRLSTKDETPSDLQAVQQQLAEAQRQSERHKSRALELEEREAPRVQSELSLRKDVERLGEQIKQREQRETQLTQALKPALMRIAELTQDMENLRIKLAQTEADLSDQKRR
jgi:pSer/pThr/pTyr-binding forkhead associated (FHA) protein